MSVRGVLTLAAIANGFGWLILVAALIEDRDYYTPWFVYPLPFLGVIIAVTGLLLITVGNTAWGIVLLSLDSLVGIILLIVMSGETHRSWATGVEAVLPVTVGTHVLWILSPLLGLLPRAAQVWIPQMFSDRKLLEGVFDRWRTSLLWIPYSYFMVSSLAGFILLLLTGWTFRAHASEIFLITFVGVPAIAGVIAIVAGLLVARRMREPWWKVILWGLALPARAWAWLWTTLLKLIFTKVLWAVLIVMLLAIAGTVAGILIANGVSGWIVLLVCVLGLGATIGGVRWGNQFGSGFTGGTPVWVWVLLVLFGIGIVGWLGGLAASVAAMALPVGLSYSLMMEAIGFTFFDNDWLNLVPPFGVLLVFFFLPLLSDRRFFDD